MSHKITPLSVFLFQSYTFWQHLPPLGRLFVRTSVPFLILMAPWFFCSLNVERFDAGEVITSETMFRTLLFLSFSVVLFITLCVHCCLDWYVSSETRRALLYAHKESGLEPNRLWMEIKNESQPLSRLEARLLKSVWNKERQDAWRRRSCAKALTFSLKEPVPVRPEKASLQKTVKPRRRV